MQKDFRAGIGYDSHPLVPGRKLVLGGVDIPYDKGLSGWSDADVAVHAVLDALCGAADLGDIGTLFPAGEAEYDGVSSLVLLERTAELLKAKGWVVASIDATIIAHAPKLSPFTKEMRERIGRSLGIEPGQITIKATTTNSLGFVGREEGMAALAVALVHK
jgi:2-C-methyl-D-erythritol 2,4-cyclodiphosphate synthase